MRIVIDPGHGLPDTGAPGKFVKEMDINLAVSQELEKILKVYGYKPLLTRDGTQRIHKGNRNADLSARPALANRLNAKCFISIHCNGFKDPKAEGFEIYTTVGQDHSDPLATAIFNSWNKFFPGQKKRADYKDNDPDKESNLKVLRECKVPACLVELGFITNPKEEKWLGDKKNHQTMAMAIAIGINNFLKG